MQDPKSNQTVLNFAIANGFKNIQNIVRKLKQKNENLDFIEIMACPGGCLNGGGQIRPEKATKSKILLETVSSIFHSQSDFKVTQPEENDKVKQLYTIWEKGIFKPDNNQLHTQYHAREKINHPLAIKW